MTGGTNDESLRPGRLEFSRLGWALAISIGLHLFGWGGYEIIKKSGILEKIQMPAWVRALTQPKEKIAREKEKPPDTEPPLVFVEVNPAASTAEAPKNAPFYSDKNSRAANPDADKDSNVPKVSGDQTEVARTEEVKRDQLNQLRPTAPPQPKEEQPKPAQQMGDLALAKPEEQKRDTTGQAEVERPRPRTLNEAYARQQANKIPGQKMKQDGGVKHRLQLSSLDTKATAFGAYDAALIEAVTRRWFDLLDNRNYASDRAGRVMLQFRLNYDGRISDMKVMENTVGDTLMIMCQKAVTDPSPFERWPSDLRRMIGEDYRTVTFTFYYN